MIEAHLAMPSDGGMGGSPRFEEPKPADVVLITALLHRSHGAGSA